MTPERDGESKSVETEGEEIDQEGMAEEETKERRRKEKGNTFIYSVMAEAPVLNGYSPF